MPDPPVDAEGFTEDDNAGEFREPSSQRLPTPSAPTEEARASTPGSPPASGTQQGNTTHDVPDHIKFLELFALYFRAQYNVPKAAIEDYLKSFKWAFGPDGVFKPRQEELRDAEEEESTHVSLSQSLETLLKRAGIESFGERYATYTRKYKGQPQQSFKPRVLYKHHSLIKQLEKVLSRPDIMAAIRKHKEHVQRPNRDQM
ncbi:hypothetical protein FRC08_010132 [Ceratobasidium sp. 394]|nr:hypothetical protein FRC08_010132 [Ceratobasidium sp. 394]